MAKPLGRKATYADLLALPENMVGEILEGELVATPRPAVRHAVIGSTLGNALGPPFQHGRGGPGGWWILDEPELHFGEDVVVPDLAGWRRERMAVPPDAPAIELAPDWVCEILSRSTYRHDRGAKMRIYARAQVAHMWIVDGANKALETYQLDGTRWDLVGIHTGADKVHAVPFDAIEIDLSDLWLPD